MGSVPSVLAQVRDPAAGERLQVLRRHLDRKLSPSLTAREIVGLVPLPAARREDLRLLISAAELCHFGGRAASATDYRGCRETYLRFAATGET